jgi:hypothetical protein
MLIHDLASLPSLIFRLMEQKPFLFAFVTLAILGMSRKSSYRRKSRYRNNVRYEEHVKPWNPSWQRLRRVTIALSWGRDCIRPWKPAEEVDHLVYHRLGRELPLLDVVPLSRGTHVFVTAARDMLGRAPVNLILRLAYAAWIFCDYEIVASLAGIMGVHGLPFSLLHTS